MDFVSALRLKAMAAVMAEDPGWDAKFRAIARYLSREFSIPLMDVYDLPLDFVLLQYYESRFETMEEEELHRQAEEMVTSPEEREAEILEAQKSDDDFFRATEMAVRAQKGKKLDTLKKVTKMTEELGGRDILEAPVIKPVAIPDLGPVDFSISEDPEFEHLMNADPLGKPK